MVKSRWLKFLLGMALTVNILRIESDGLIRDWRKQTVFGSYPLRFAVAIVIENNPQSGLPTCFWVLTSCTRGDSLGIGWNSSFINNITSFGINTGINGVIHLNNVIIPSQIWGKNPVTCIICSPWSILTCCLLSNSVFVILWYRETGEAADTEQFSYDCSLVILQSQVLLYPILWGRKIGHHSPLLPTLLYNLWIRSWYQWYHQ